MQNNQLISIIVTAYNIEAYLPRCLDSILWQSYQKLEIIVVDDGSVDGTGAICDEYARRDSRIKIIHQSNQGPSGARNAGLAIAKGDYIGYVDGDDWIEAEMYEAMIAACEEERAQLAICAYRHIEEDTDCIKHMKCTAKEKQEEFSGRRYVLSRQEALDTYVCDNKSYHIYNSVWSKLFKRELVKEMQFPVGKKSEDISYTTNALVNMNHCVFLDTPYYNYVVNRKDSIMNEKLHERRFNDEIPFWKEQMVYFKEIGMEELSEKAFYHFCRRMLFYFIEFKDKKMKVSAKEAVLVLKKDKDKIKEIYKKEFITTGDKARMKLFLLNPDLFYFVAKVYDKCMMLLHK